MRSKFALVVGIVAIGMTAAVMPLLAHHAHGNYATEMTDFDAVITEVHGLNPHSWIYVSRKDASGKEQLWALEGGGANGIKKLETDGKPLKVGDKLKVRCHVLRDGTPGCLLGYIKDASGLTYDMDEGAKTVTLPDF